jgi:hypothetical protein
MLAAYVGDEVAAMAVTCAREKVLAPLQRHTRYKQRKPSDVHSTLASLHVPRYDLQAYLESMK